MMAETATISSVKGVHERRCKGGFDAFTLMMLSSERAPQTKKKKKKEWKSALKISMKLGRRNRGGENLIFGRGELLTGLTLLKKMWCSPVVENKSSASS